MDVVGKGGWAEKKYELTLNDLNTSLGRPSEVLPRGTRSFEDQSRKDEAGSFA